MKSPTYPLNPPVLRSLLAAALALAASSAGAEEPQTKPLGLRSFERHLLPVLTENCAYCHQQKLGSVPFLMDSDSTEATYEMIKRYADDFEDPRASLLFSKGIQQNMAGEAVAATLEAAIANWWRGGENTASWAGKSIARSVRVPVLSPNRYTVLRVPLGPLSDLGDLGDPFGQAVLEVDIKEATEHSYQICRPRIQSSKHAVAFKGIHVVLNDALVPQANSYASLWGEATSTAPLSHACQSVPQSLGMGVDRIGFAFDRIAASDTPLLPAKRAVPIREKPALGRVFDERTVGLAGRFVDLNYDDLFSFGSDKASYRHFQIQATPVTQLQWYLVMKGSGNETPSHFRTRALCDPGSFPLPSEPLPPMCKHHPVESIPAMDVVSPDGFLARLNSMQSDYTYRLPTDDEFASLQRSDESPSVPWGLEPGGQYSWTKANSRGSTHNVATRLPTLLPGATKASGRSVYDLIGNVAVMVLMPDPSARNRLVVRGRGIGYYDLDGSRRLLDSAEEAAGAYNGVDPHKEVGLRLVRVPRAEAGKIEKMELTVNAIETR